jgi:murein L,D-transpeptidase YcbB/YkuD
MSEAAAAPSRQAWLADAVRMHPLYEALRAAGTHNEEEARVVRANLDRLRWLPADPGERYILVDAAVAQLTMVEHGRATGTMRVIVGKPGMATPMLAGLIRYAAYNPYWNLPPDLSAQRALRVLHDGPGVLASERLEILADWSPEAAVLDPASVDWRAMGAGQLGRRLRQLPGKRNMMGSVKFMLPNPLGIYLHDTPDKAAFQQTARRLSSGCVRVEDPARLAAWLFGKTPEPTGLAEERIDLPRPVPVYVVYLTAAPEAGKVALRPDPEGRDALT